MQYMFAADPEGDIARRLAIYSNYYITAMKQNEATPAEYYSQFLESTQKVEAEFDGILEVFKNAQDDTESSLLDAYSRHKDGINTADKKRKAIIELLKAADYLGVQPLIDTCANDLSEQYKDLFHNDLQVIKQETDRINHTLYRLIVEKVLLSHQHEFGKLQLEHQLLGHNGAINFVNYSSDGSKLISASVGEKAIIWNVNRGTKSNEFNITNELDLTPYNIRLTQQQHGTIMERVHDRHDSYGVMVPATYSPDCSYMASPSPDNTVKISRYTRDGYTPLYKLAGHDGPVRLVAYSPDGLQLATGSADKTVIIWTNSNYKKMVSSFDMLQVLYVSSRLEGLQGFPSTEPKKKNDHVNKVISQFALSLQNRTESPLKDDEKGEQTESSLYTRMANYVGASVVSLFGVNQVGEGFVSLCKQKQRAEEEYCLKKKRAERDPYLNKLHNSLPDEIKKLLDKKE